MHLLYFSRDYTSHDHRFLAALAKSEHRVSYLRLERSGFQFEKRALPPEIEIIPWRGGQAPARLQDGLSLLNDLRRVIRDVKPDLIQAGPIQRCAFLVALAGFKPLVSMSWGYDLLQDARRGPAWEWATRYTLARSAALVCDCDTIRQIAVSYGMSGERIVAFPWGIDLDHFAPCEKPAPSNAPGAPFDLLSTRGWEPIYGVDVIGRAFVKVAARRPELRLTMLGNGSQSGALRQILSQGVMTGPQPGLQTEAPAASHQVLFPGQVGYADLPRYYHAADLYVSASHSDGTSISLLEAMACGRPALVSDIPGNREWVKPGVNGWLFQDGEAEALAQAILHAVENRPRLPEMGRAARQIAERRADWNKNFPQLYRAYEIANHHS
jgi:glycosyltransferase involved in cell wall biosynthesis